MKDDYLFSDAMKEVQPIKQDKAHVGAKKTNNLDFAAKQEAAINLKQRDDNYLSSFNKNKLQPYDIVAFKRPGVQNGVYRQLRLGKYDLDGRLDLHRLTVEEARHSVFDFIRESMQYDLRSVLIIHGRGDRDKGEKAILKNLTVQWLYDIPEVLAFHSAQKRDGGSGALYILLKKSERAKQRNREQFGLR